jgi:hypothetical protein
MTNNKKLNFHNKNYKLFVQHMDKDLQKRGIKLTKKQRTNLGGVYWTQLNHHANKTYGGALDVKKANEEYIKSRNENEQIKKYINYATLAKNGYTLFKIGKHLYSAFI